MGVFRIGVEILKGSRQNIVRDIRNLMCFQISCDFAIFSCPESNRALAVWHSDTYKPPPYKPPVVCSTSLCVPELLFEVAKWMQ